MVGVRFDSGWMINQRQGGLPVLIALATQMDITPSRDSNLLIA
jgi:hypothetical protein